MDSLNNTYRGLRILRDTQPFAGNWLYAEFGGSFNFSSIVFHELYDMVSVALLLFVPCCFLRSMLRSVPDSARHTQSPPFTV
jgi:hypothetical protein